MAETMASGDEQLPIVVTAQRRAEAPESVPISLTALSGEQLEEMQATDMASLDKVAPSLVMMRTGAFTQPYLRGIGKRSTLGVENAVATYVDGVYLASSISALLDLRGIQRVEILNGPQGTLFGRNTTGGVIQIVTRDPVAGQSAEAEVQVGTYGYVRGDLYMAGGTDELAGNIAVSLSHSGGYGGNLRTGKEDIGEVGHSFVGRTKWVWHPADTTKVTFAADYQDIDHDFTQLPADGYPPLGRPSVTGRFSADQNDPNRSLFRYGGGSARVETEVGAVTVMSLSAVRRLHARYAADLDMGPQPLLSGAPTAEQKQISQEFQVQSAPNKRLQWAAGLYYIFLQEQYQPTLFGYGGSYSARLGGRTMQILTDTGDVSSFAGYGQSTFSIDEATRVTAGLRYTIEERSVEARGEQHYSMPPFVRPIPGLPLLSQEPFRNRKTFEELSWRASIDHDISHSLMGFASASRGFQSGGWNLQSPQAPAFAPETLDAFESGLKYVNRSGRLGADASAFLYDYSNLQVSAFTPLGSLTTNATSAKVYGLDFQLRAQFGKSTTVTLGGQWLHANYDSFPNATCTNYDTSAAVPYLPFACDATGNRLPFAPRFKANAGIGRHVSLSRHGSVLLNGNVAYTSGYFSEPDNVVRQHAFATVDVSAEWRPGASAPSVRIWVLNLTDARYSEAIATFPTAGVSQRPAAPRRLGISIDYKL